MKFAFLLLAPTCLWAAEPSLTRGPYLQMSSTTAVNVRWRTDKSNKGTVRFGVNPEELTKTYAEAESTTEHEVRITGLTPGTQFFYQIEAGNSVLTTPKDCFFRTPPPAGSTPPIRFWVLGDSGTADKNAAAVRDAFATVHAKVPAQFMIMLGDNAYLKGSDEDYQEAVFDMYPTQLRQLPLWSCVGNHETYSVKPGKNAVLPYFAMFSFPTKGEAGGVPSGTENYYSFNHGNIHFVCLDSMLSSRATDGAMAKWLQADLQTSLQPWNIAFFHHPPYSKGTHNTDVENDSIEMRKNFLPILEGYGVDLVLCGHSHVYERSKLIDGHYGLSPTFSQANIRDGASGNSETTGPYRKAAAGMAPHRGTVYVVEGSSGKTGGKDVKLNHPAMFVSLNKLGSLVVDVNKNRLDVNMLRETGEVDDQFTILKGAP